MSGNSEARDDGSTAMEAALRNPLIAERILIQAEFKHKKDLRSLNRFWRDSTLNAWRKLAAFRLSVPDQFTRRSNQTRNECDEGAMSINDFDKLMKGQTEIDWTPPPFCIKEKPFQRLILHYGDFWLPPEQLSNLQWLHLRNKISFGDGVFKDSQLFQFLEKYGPTVHYLRLQDLTFVPGNFVPGMKWSLQKACPQLKGLSLQVRELCKPYETVVCEQKFYYQQRPQVNSFSQYQNLNPDVESKLTELSVLIKREKYFQDGSYSFYICADNMDDPTERKKEEIWNSLLCIVPNLKVFSFRETRVHRFTRTLQVLRLPIAKDKYLALEELEWKLPAYDISDYGEITIVSQDSLRKKIIELNRYIEQFGTSLKRIKIGLPFDHTVYEHSNVQKPCSDFRRLCILTKNILTELTITFLKPFWIVREPHLENDDSDCKWINCLNGYDFPNLTQLNIIFSSNYYKEGVTLFFDFSSLRGLPKLQKLLVLNETVTSGLFGERLNPCLKPISSKHLAAPSTAFQCRKKEPEEFPLHLQLNNLTEFVFDNLQNQFTKESLKILLGWMKKVKKLTLCLDAATFPMVLEMLPELEELTMIGDFEELTEVQKKKWMSALTRSHLEAREREEKKKAKRKLKRERRNAELDRKWGQIETEEKEWLQNQEDSWTFVSRKKKEVGNVSFPKGQEGKEISSELDDLAIFDQLRKGKILRIFKNGFVKGNYWKRFLMEYKME